MNEELFQSLFDDIEARPLTVSELNAEVRSIVERQFANIWVEGEIVQFTQATSGHWYFNLNDGSAQIKCVCWKGQNYRIRFKPKSGISVRIRGKLGFYEARGEMQIVVESLEPAGEGALAAAFEQIRAKLDAEGLFSPDLKRPIPFLPRRVAVITSRTGAAYHDIHSVLARRSRSVSILLVPALVQGEGAADGIRRAIEGVNAYNARLPVIDQIDVLIVGRGGGSAEDLWAFNDELLARTIRASSIPVISAVGHEIDWSISDLVADMRAATPSAAAEIVAAKEEDILAGLSAAEASLKAQIEYKMHDALTRSQGLSSDLNNSFSTRIYIATDRFTKVSGRLTPATLRAKYTSICNRLSTLDQKRDNAIERALKTFSEDLNVSMAKLNTLSPLAVLTRGFSITQAADGKVLRNAAVTKPGDKLKIRLERGKLNVEVLSAEE